MPLCASVFPAVKWGTVCDAQAGEGDIMPAIKPGAWPQSQGSGQFVVCEKKPGRPWVQSEGNPRRMEQPPRRTGEH